MKRKILLALLALLMLSAIAGTAVADPKPPGGTYSAPLPSTETP